MPTGRSPSAAAVLRAPDQERYVTSVPSRTTDPGAVKSQNPPRPDRREDAMAATSLAALATINLATEAEIPWPSTGALGMGVIAPSGELLKSAVTPCEADA